MSSIGTFDYNLARFFCDLASPSVLLFSQIKSENLSENFFLSCDVTSLFTNIPLQETIDVVINPIFNRNPNLNITKEELEKLSIFATSQTHFTFNSKSYYQIDGIAMGLLLFPALANILNLSD